MERGSIYIATLKPRSGSEQQGRRPVIIVSDDGFNLAPRWRSMLVVPVSTSSRQRGRGPTSVQLFRGAGGLVQDSVALCHQVTTLDRSKLQKRLGKLSAEDMALIGEGLRAALSL